MSAPILNLISRQTNVDQLMQNEFGETPLAFSPTIRLADGGEAIPQQYLDVDRKLDNLSNVVEHISVPAGYQLFTGQEGSCLYLVVGVFGKENYPASAEIAIKDKVVYSRRWLIEPTTPTSEIVQTALLAVKKAREHEARELFTVRIDRSLDQNSRVATPFNCHLDLPLMAGSESTLTSTSALDVDKQLKGLKFAGYTFEVQQRIELGRKRLFELNVVGKSSHFLELAGSLISVICQHQDQRDFVHQLINALIARSDRFVDELVSFKGFTRFSHTLDPIALAKFSYKTRNIKAEDTRFDENFENMSYKVDASKAPFYNDGELGRQQRQLISSFSSLGGYLPLEKTANR
ncbi:MAG: hypothetical protein JKX81_10545 [Arenicella sp.]|nr:hypothetical protein [Arenicella sp.]